MIYNVTLNNRRKVCNSCTVCIVLFVIVFLIIISVSSAFAYFHWYLKSDNCTIIINLGTAIVIY